MFFEQDTAGGDDVFCLGAVKTYAFDVLLQSGHAQLQQRLRRVRLFIQRSRCPVDAFVSGLRGQDDGDQQLEWRRVFQFSARFGIGLAETFENGLAFCGVHGFFGDVVEMPDDYNGRIVPTEFPMRSLKARMFKLRQWLAVALLATVAAAALAEPVTVERDSVLRAEPRTDAGVAGNLAKGATGDAVARQGAWVQVKSGAVTGWLYSFNVRFGAINPGNSSGGAGTGSVLGRVFGPRQQVNVTATIGIRGLEEEDLKQAHFDEGQMRQLDGYAASREQAAVQAGDSGLSAVRVEYLDSASGGGQ